MLRPPSPPRQSATRILSEDHTCHYVVHALGCQRYLVLLQAQDQCRLSGAEVTMNTCMLCTMYGAQCMCLSCADLQLLITHTRFSEELTARHPVSRQLHAMTPRVRAYTRECDSVCCWGSLLDKQHAPCVSCSRFQTTCKLMSAGLALGTEHAVLFQAHCR
jgi:hypothetical protein